MAISFSKTRVQRRNYQKRGNPIDKAANIMTEAGLSITTQDLDTRIMKLYFGGSEFTVASGSITGEPLALNLTDAKWAAGIEDALLITNRANIDLTATVALKYGTAGNVTNTVTAANYTLDAFGNLKISKAFLESLTPAQATHWTLDYTHKGIASGRGFAAGDLNNRCTKTYWVRISGFNESECGNGEYHVVDIYKAVLTPEGDTSLIGEDFSELQFSGLVMSDETRPNTPEWEEYFRVQRFSHA